MSAPSAVAPAAVVGSTTPGTVELGIVNTCGLPVNRPGVNSTCAEPTWFAPCDTSTRPASTRTRPARMAACSELRNCVGRATVPLVPSYWGLLQSRVFRPPPRSHADHHASVQPVLVRFTKIRPAVAESEPADAPRTVPGTVVRAFAIMYGADWNRPGGKLMFADAGTPPWVGCMRTMPEATDGMIALMSPASRSKSPGQSGDSSPVG